MTDESLKREAARSTDKHHISLCGRMKVLGMALGTFVATTACTSESAHVAGAANGISIHHAFAPQAVLVGDTANATMAVYFSIQNTREADTLEAITTPIASHAMLHTSMQHDGMVSMMADSVLIIDSRRTVRLAPGARHVMLDGLHRFPLAGDSLSLTLHFRHAGTIRISVPVIDYTSLDSAVRASR